ncbi:Crp/Fnr family transcriptional regulator [Lacrimispora sphenoides]|uniref:CRP/FNR family transcriptional regulator, anaerobic regulatory protein n=1 Tax=Lacrimispora sphenoides JCM 1415 TaxID=1297793 RepID=A0ABY1CGF6_9FIRM|nr:Crp/Fnr family transcriptional regulator [Lacrimispora sphenoides]SEU02607.1 CRP/FNR family transcriptional regulator, anaerobic regulatory protein [[Clostridium] sphenoides JCM 1415]SUY48693.1 Crp/Fnr family transcriptional regulator [Lacrimispora sphenoides]
MELKCSCCNKLCTSKIPLFESLSIEEQKELVSRARHLDYKRGETVFHEYDPADKILVIRYGKVKVSRYSLEGKEYVFDILAEGDIYGEQNIFGGKAFEANAIALGECGVCLISLTDIQELILKKPEIGVKLLNVVGQKLSAANELVQLLSVNDAKARIAGFLLFRSSRIKGETIELTRDDISAYINVRRETISRKLGELRKEGAIELEGNRKIHVRNKDILRDIFDNET